MAQERKKRRIVLTSLLKPVDDTRMFEKMGTSLAQSGMYDVFIIGYPSSAIPSFPGVQFISLRPFKRISLGRFFAGWNAFLEVWRVKPSIMIFGTHELLLPAVLLKILLNVRIIYDVRENYYRNILHSGNFPSWVRWPLALMVRFKEKLLAPSIDHFFLAEKEYENEFKFHRGGWTVLENKAPTSWGLLRRASPPDESSKGRISLLFSGTLAEPTGVFHAIQLAKELHRLDTNVSLTLIGYAALQEVREKIQQEIMGCDFIQLVGGDSLVPHSEILGAIQAAHFGIISYPPSQHTANSHPTKLFEYLNAQLPVITDRRWPWIKRYEEIQPFVFLDFSNPDYPALLADLKTKTFYISPPPDVTWKPEEKKLLHTLEKVS